MVWPTGESHKPIGASGLLTRACVLQRWRRTSIQPPVQQKTKQITKPVSHILSAADDICIKCGEQVFIRPSLDILDNRRCTYFKRGWLAPCIVTLRNGEIQSRLAMRERQKHSLVTCLLLPSCCCRLRQQAPEERIRFRPQCPPGRQSRTSQARHPIP